jgi:hypothetical protein
MKFAVRDKTMFQAAFSPPREEARTLLDYVRFLWEEAGTRIAAYIRFMARTLKPGATLLSVNPETSRYLEGNALNNFHFSLYHATPKVQPAPFGTDLVGHIPGLRMAQAEVVNSAQRPEAARH